MLTELNTKNKLLFFGLIALLGFLSVWSEDITAQSKTQNQQEEDESKEKETPIMYYDIVKYEIYPSGAEISSDYKSGALTDSERPYTGPIWSGKLQVSNFQFSSNTGSFTGSEGIGGMSEQTEAAIEAGTYGARRSYGASIPRICDVNPIYSVPKDFTCEDHPDLCECWTFAEALGQLGGEYETVGLPVALENAQEEEAMQNNGLVAGVEVGTGQSYKLDPGTGGYYPSDKEDEVGVEFGAATNFFQDSKIETTLWCSDDLNQQYNCGTAVGYEERTLAEREVSKTSFGAYNAMHSTEEDEESPYYDTGALNTIQNYYNEEASATSEVEIPTAENVGAEEAGAGFGSDFGELVGKKLANQMENKEKGILDESGKPDVQVSTENFSMGIVSDDIRDFSFGYALPGGMAGQLIISERYPNDEMVQINCADGNCPQMSVEDSFSMWADSMSGYPLPEKDPYWHTDFVSIFDVGAEQLNPLSGAFVESYKMSADVKVEGSYKTTNLNGKLYDVAGKFGEMHYETAIQTASVLDESGDLPQLRMPGYTCEYKGQAANGWVMNGNDPDTGSGMVRLLGSNIGSDKMAVKIDGVKVLSEEDLTMSYDDEGNEMPGLLESGMERYKNVGPEIISRGATHYVLFASESGTNPNDELGRAAYKPYLATIRGDKLAGVQKIGQEDETVSNNYRIRADFGGDGELKVLLQDRSGECGGGDPAPACLYYYDNVNGSRRLVNIDNDTGVTTNAQYYTGFDSVPTSDDTVIVYHTGDSGVAKNIEVVKITGSEKTNPVKIDEYTSEAADPFVFKIDKYGIRHLLVHKDKNLYHTVWTGEEQNQETGEYQLVGLFTRTIPLPLKDKGARIEIADFTFSYPVDVSYYTFLDIIYTVYPKDKGEASAVVVLAERDPQDYRLAEGDQPDLPIPYDDANLSYPVAGAFDAYVVDQNAIVDWDPADASRPFMEARTITRSNGTIDAVVQFGSQGWVVYLSDIPGYSATSRAWTKVDEDSFSYTYTTDFATSDAIPLYTIMTNATEDPETGEVNYEEVIRNYSEGGYVVQNQGTFNPTRDAGVISAGELMTLVDDNRLSDGVNIVNQKLPMLQYVDNVAAMMPTKAGCWETLSQRQVIKDPLMNVAVDDTEPTQQETTLQPGPGEDDEDGSGEDDGDSGELGRCGGCKESWDYTGPIYGDKVEEPSLDQIKEMAGLLVYYRPELYTMDPNNSSKLSAVDTIQTMCDIAGGTDDNGKPINVSCPFLFAVWTQESTNDNRSYSTRPQLCDNLEVFCSEGSSCQNYHCTCSSNANCPSEYSCIDGECQRPKYLSFGCKYDPAPEVYDSWEAQVQCAAVSIRNRVQEWNNGATEIQNSECCTANTKFGYLMEKYTPTDTYTEDGNGEGRSNLKASLIKLAEIGVIDMEDIVTY